MSPALLSLVGLILASIVYGEDPLDFWGNVLVTSNGNVQESNSYGFANVRYNQPHTSKSKFPIGSNTKLFTTIAIYQLQEQGLLNVNDSVTDYLDQSDFIKFGYPNITEWCPHYINSTECKPISFINLLSMSSGMVASLHCPYNDTSPYTEWCWDFCSLTFLPYKGSIAYYVGTFIDAPLVFQPGSKYEYNNMNFILAGYIVEKLSKMDYGLYIQQNIFDVLGLESIYYDPWDGQFGINDYRVDEYFLIRDEDDPSKSLGTGICAPYMNLGSANAAGGMVSDNNDMHIFYGKMFNNSDNYIPPVFKSRESLDSILYPYQLIHDNPETYYSQGVIVSYNSPNHNTSWPDEILYTGGVFCATTAIRMIPDDSQLIVTAFTNADIVLVPDGENGYNKLRYDTPYSTCQMARNRSFLLLAGENAGVIANQLIDKYSE